ncbi:MAG: helix-turn-helix domain-containing protein [Chloroflexota bacterium]
MPIIQRYQAGESQADLAHAFGISYQRIHQIIHGKLPLFAMYNLSLCVTTLLIL